MIDDVVRNLGYLMLGTRFKRIGDRLQTDATRIAEAHGVKIQSHQYPYLGALDRFGPMTIGEMAEAVGLSQPGVTRSIGQLAKLGMVAVRKGRDDRRQRIVSLTPAGRHQLELGQNVVWPLVEAAVADLCDPLSGQLLEQLAQIEDGLAERPLEERLDGQRRRR